MPAIPLGNGRLASSTDSILGSKYGMDAVNAYSTEGIPQPSTEVSR
jgi:hypothetical protein